MNERLFDRPVPVDEQSWNWTLARQPMIKENHEPLVKANFYPERILASPEYFDQKIKGALVSTYIRRGVYQKLVEASYLLPKGYKFLLLDVWRSNQAQQSLFDILKRKLSKQFPELTQDELLKRVLTTVAPPSSDPDHQPSPHNTGGAVDLTIVDEIGLPLSFGTPFDDPTAIARTSYFEARSIDHDLSNEELTYLKNRRLLFNVMTSVGFTNYTDEWWHYDYGNQNWAWKSEQANALYGTIQPSFMWQNPLESEE